MGTDERRRIGYRFAVDGSVPMGPSPKNRFSASSEWIYHPNVKTSPERPARASPRAGELLGGRSINRRNPVA